MRRGEQFGVDPATVGRIYNLNFTHISLFLSQRSHARGKGEVGKRWPTAHQSCSHIRKILNIGVNIGTPADVLSINHDLTSQMTWSYCASLQEGTTAIHFQPVAFALRIADPKGVGEYIHALNGRIPRCINQKLSTNCLQPHVYRGHSLCKRFDLSGVHISPLPDHRILM